MVDNDNYDATFDLDTDDGDILDSLMESKSVNEELSELFPAEEKYVEVN